MINFTSFFDLPQKCLPRCHVAKEQTGDPFRQVQPLSTKLFFEIRNRTKNTI